MGEVEAIKQTDYFDYDGNISSAAPLADVSTLPNKLGFMIESEKIEDAPVAAAPEIELPSRSENAGQHESALPDDILAAIQAFESMNLSAVETDYSEVEKPVKPQKKEESEAEDGDVSKPEETSKKEPEEFSKKINKAKEKVKYAAHEIKELKKKEDEKEVSKVKHFFIILTLFLVVIVVFTGVVYVFMQSINKENKRIALFNKNAAEVCADYSIRYGNPNYENLYDEYKVEGYALTGICFARELDFDNDGESELMISYNKSGTYYNEVWGFSDKKFKLLFSDVAAQSDDKKKDAYSVLYRSKNRYYIAKFDQKKLNKFSLYHLRHGKFVRKYEVEYDKKAKSYSVDGKDDTNGFERIKYSVLKEEKASTDVDKVSEMIENFKGSSSDDDVVQGSQTLENAYFSIVQDYNSRYGVSKYKEENGLAYINGLAVVELIDFDGDGKDELLLVYRKTVKERNESESGEDMTVNVDRYYCDIYRYSGNRAVLTYSNEGLSNSLNNDKDIYYIIRRQKKKAYYCLNSFTNSDYGNHISAVSAEYKYDGTSFIQSFKASYTTDYGYSKYYLNGKSVSKYTFNDEGYKNPLFDSEEKYDKDHYRVTYVQQKRIDVSDMKEIPKATENTIQKLNQSYSASEN